MESDTIRFIREEVAKTLDEYMGGHITRVDTLRGIGLVLSKAEWQEAENK